MIKFLEVTLISISITHIFNFTASSTYDFVVSPLVSNFLGDFSFFFSSFLFLSSIFLSGES